MLFLCHFAHLKVSATLTENEQIELMAPITSKYGCHKKADCWLNKKQIVPFCVKDHYVNPSKNHNFIPLCS